MAASSLEEQEAPTEFELSSSFGSSSGLKIAIERCPVCEYSKRPFYCKICVNQGLFVHSKGTYPERFTDKSHKLEILTKERDSVLQQVKQSVYKKHVIDQKKQEIQECKRKITLLKLTLSASKEMKSAERQALDVISRENHARRVKGRNHQEKKQRIKDYIKLIRTSNGVKFNTLGDVLENLSKERKKHVADLTHYIFPVLEVRRDSMVEESANSASTEKALRDATHTTYIRGQWVYTDGNNGDFRIVEPTLPSTGDYSPYNIWVATSRENNGDPDNSLRNPGHRISAALCYASQLVSILSSLLDVPLVHRQNYSIFCGAEVTEKNFRNSVACLNQNVLYLCFSQGLADCPLIDPRNTLGNICLLVRHTSLGRVQSFIVNQELLQSVGEITVSTDEEREEDECQAELFTREGEIGLPPDWEEVPHNIDESEIGNRTVFSSTLQSTSYCPPTSDPAHLTASAFVTSAAASLVSFFRGPTPSDKR
ncbi:beclin 1-associated autophagy-related key regulator-like [Pecten maximus]|uniref:beclin 1-associated autophagy-related key regulator-like n=1 Tax=Pecten maximus TaxID=6579 RepID=UPI0014580BC5|nr:beclin 1-associated autophagy-related key regulator-like [Pecten maximus]